MQTSIRYSVPENKVVLAFDSFKGSLSALEACESAASGLRRVPGVGEIIECPLSDGGEGFAAAMLRAGNGYEKQLLVTGPEFRTQTASLTLLDEGKTAVIESAQACGLGLPLLGERNPANLTSLGVGEMLQAAIAAGAHRIIIGLGGTATNDAGLGLLQALGWKFLAQNGEELPPAGKSLSAISTILPGIPLPAGVEIIAACDVRNPLYGPQGAAVVYGPQKGASPHEVAELDAGLQHFAQLADEICGDNYSSCAGAGAAGGLGYALLAFLKARFQPGAELAIDLSKLKETPARCRLLYYWRGLYRWADCRREIARCGAALLLRAKYTADYSFRRVAKRLATTLSPRCHRHFFHCSAPANAGRSNSRHRCFIER